MKAYTLISCALGTVMLASCADKAEQQATAYFESYISGTTDSLFTGGNILKQDQVAAATQKVWNAWCNAVKAVDQELLPAPGQLADADSMAWHLPAELEPNAVMPFYWGYKGDSTATAPRPLFLYLHGSGPKEREWATGLILANRFEDSPSVYFIPQIPNEGEYYRWWQRAKQFAWERLLRQSLASGAIDADSVYIFGISEGGYGSQRLASFYADYLAGAGPMAGGEPLRNAPVENLRNTAFSLRTGDKDFGFYRNRLTYYTLRALDSVHAINPDEFVYNIELIPDSGHHINYSPTTPWLKQYKRNAYPRHISWENFEMDGRRRQGFYNLFIDKEPGEADSLRIRYDMDITGNEIDLNVSSVTYAVTEVDPYWGIPLDFERSYSPVNDGTVTIYLNDELVNLSEPVTVRVNGKEVYSGVPELLFSNLVNSCAAFYDPKRLFPAAITVNI